MKQQQLEAELANAYTKIKLLEEQIEKEISGEAWRERKGQRAKERKETNNA